MAGPMAFSRLINILSGMLALMFASRLGRDALAATALINASGVLVFLIGMSILFAIGVVAAQLYGAQREHEIGAMFQQSLLLCIFICIFMILAYWNMDKLLLLFGEKPMLVNYVRRYFHVLVWGSPSLLVLVVFQQLLYSLKKQRVVMLSNLFCFIPYILLTYALIQGHFGLPQLGVAGMAIGFTVLNIANSLVLIIYTLANKEFKKYQLFTKHSHAGLKHLRKLFQVGWPMAVQFAGEYLSYFLIIVMIGWLSETQLAAFNVVLQWQQLVIVPIFGVSEATGILVGHAAGAKHYSHLKPILNATIVIISVLTVLVALLYTGCHKALSGFYIDIHSTKNEQLLHIIAVLFAFSVFSRFFDNLKIIISGALRGLHDTKYAMWVAIILAYFVALPAGYFLAFKLHMKSVGFVVANILVLAVASVLLLLRWRRQCTLLRSKIV